MNDLKGQLTLRGIIVGCLGCIIITATSVYTALKMGALPWPIIFAAIISLFFLKVISRGASTLNEANVTHTVMSAGSMVAGGLAFTIPGAWMLGLADQVSLVDMFVVAFAGVVMGLVCTAVLRRHFIEEAELEFPIGNAAAQTLIAGDSGGSTGKKLFGGMGFAAAFAALRDFVGAIPAMVATFPVPGVTFGIYLSPMMLSVGFLVGTVSVCIWFAGALLGNLGIPVVGTALGLCDVTTAQGIVSSLGMGTMMGFGFAVIAKDIIPKGVKLLRSAAVAESQGQQRTASGRKMVFALSAVLVAAVALVVCMALGIGPVASIVIVLLAFVTTAMSAQSAGQTGIDPMEIFGLIVLLIVAAFSQVAQVKLFFVAGIIAVACGLAGDVMNDFKAGHVLGTNPRAQLIGQAIGGFIGAIVAVLVMSVLVSAYGPEAFGPSGLFVSAQASVVAAMVNGIPNVAAFVIGLLLGFVPYLFGFPSMMLGLGIYLPFYLSFTAFLGAMAKVLYDAIAKRRSAGLPEGERTEKLEAARETGLVVASGFLGGESIVGIILAMVVACSGLAG